MLLNCHPKRIRGRLVGLLQWSVTRGIVIMFYIGYGCSSFTSGENRKERSNEGRSSFTEGLLPMVFFLGRPPPVARFARAFVWFPILELFREGSRNRTLVTVWAHLADSNDWNYRDGLCGIYLPNGCKHLFRRLFNM
jgi:hypothetical protein